MTGRRSSGSRITEDEANELISKLQSLLPEDRRRNLGHVSKLNFLLTYILKIDSIIMMNAFDIYIYMYVC